VVEGEAMGMVRVFGGSLVAILALVLDLFLLLDKVNLIVREYFAFFLLGLLLSDDSMLISMSWFSLSSSSSSD